MMRRFQSSLIVFAATLILGGCESLRIGQPLSIGEGDWRQEGGTENRSRLDNSAPSPPLAERWNYNAKAGFGFGTPLVAGDRLILATRSGEIHVVDLRDGDRIGNVSVGDAIEGTPVLVTPRILVVPVYGGKYGLLAYDLVDGSRDWEIRDAHHEAGLLLVGEDVIAADVYGVVRSLNGVTGNMNWEHTLEESGGFSAAPVQLENDLLMLCGTSGSIALLRPSTGEVVTTFDTGYPVLRTPSVHGEIAFIPTSRGRFYALRSDGEELWSVKTENENVRFASPATSGERVFVGATDGILRSLDATTGEVLWEREFDGNVSAAPLISDGFVYVGTYDRTFAALDIETGEVVWQTEVEGRIKSPAVTQDGLLIVLSEPKDVVAFGTEHIAQQ